MAGHKHPNYFKIYLWLLVLFVISVAGPEVAELMGLEGLNRMLLVLSTAFGIALVKAYMVCAYFMHLKFEKIYAPYVLLSCIALLFIFFFGVATDVMKPDGQNWVKTYVEPEGGAAHHGDAHGEDAHDSHDDHGQGVDDSHGH